MVPLPGHQFAFVLRVRLEVEANDQHRLATVRGMLQPIGSDVVRYFSSFEDIPKIVEEFTGKVAR